MARRPRSPTGSASTSNDPTLGLGCSSSRAGSGAIGSDRANPEHPETLATRCSTWRVIVSTRSNVLYDRCTTEHGRPRQLSRNRERAGQAGRAGSQRAVDPPTLLLTSDEPSRLSPRDVKQAFRWSEAIWWAWEDFNLRPHPYQVSTAKRCAERRFPRSPATVRGQGMRSYSSAQTRWWAALGASQRATGRHVEHGSILGQCHRGGSSGRRRASATAHTPLDGTWPWPPGHPGPAEVPIDISGPRSRIINQCCTG